MVERVRVEGLRELNDALHDLPKATAKNTLRRVARKRLEPIVLRAASLVPVDQGDLGNSLTVGTKLSKRQRKGRKKEGKHDIEMFAGPGPHPQAHLQEFGSSIHEPQPFMRPAWDAGKDALLEGIKDDLWAEVRKAAARLARKRAS